MRRVRSPHSRWHRSRSLHPRRQRWPHSPRCLHSHGRAVTPRSGESPRAHGPDAASADSGGRSRRNLADPPLASRCFGDQERRLLRDTSRRSAGRAGGRAAEWTKQVICARTGSAHGRLVATQVCLWLGEPRVSVAWRAAADCRRAQDELRRTGPGSRAATVPPRRSPQ